MVVSLPLGFFSVTTPEANIQRPVRKMLSLLGVMGGAVCVHAENIATAVINNKNFFMLALNNLNVKAKKLSLT